MRFLKTPIEGLLLIEPTVHRDDRGAFMETFNARAFAEQGITDKFVQDNQSFSRKNVIRGLHFQTGDHAQGKLVRVIHGSVLDVAVDLRNGSPTFGRHYSVVLDATAGNMLWIPSGFAHGFESLEDDTVFHYKVTAYYRPAAEAGIRYDDPGLGIEWRTRNPLVSEKDLILPTLREWADR